MYICMLVRPNVLSSFLLAATGGFVCSLALNDL